MRILAISGSLRRGSHNSSLLRAVGELLPPTDELVFWDGLKGVPPYDEDDDVEPAPAAVASLREIAEQPNATIDSATPLAEAFAFLEEQDFERVPVVENGKLVGVLSRSVVQRRLAEDEPPDEPED